jgi:hypothetical protein
MTSIDGTASKLVAFADLDDTLFQTLRKRNVPGSVTAGLGPDGTPLSFACPKQQKLLSCLLDQGIVIPTTARNHESFKRVQLKFNSFVILNFGATLLNPDGTLNDEWHQQMTAQAQVHKQALFEQFEAARAFDSLHGLGLNIRTVGDFGETWYVLVKHKGHDEGALEKLHQEWLRTAPTGFTIRRNDNNLTLSPGFFDKKHTVLSVIERFFNREKDVFLGLGDSLSDFDFMSTCDFLVVPSKSQLHNAFPGDSK